MASNNLSQHAVEVPISLLHLQETRYSPYIMTEHHISNHLEGHINRNGNVFLKHFAEFLKRFAEISMVWFTTSVFRT